METEKEYSIQSQSRGKREGSDGKGPRRLPALLPSQRQKVVGQTLGFFVEVLCQNVPFNLKEFLDSLEKEILFTVLAKVGGNQKEAARALGLKYTTLNEKIRKYNIGFEKKPQRSSPLV